MAGVHAIERLEQAAIRPKGFDLAACWGSLRQAFERGRLKLKASIRVSPHALDRIERLGAEAAHHIRAAAVDRSGWRTATFPIEAIPYDAELLLGFGDLIEVLEPLALREEIAALAARTAALYGNTILSSSNDHTSTAPSSHR